MAWTLKPYACEICQTPIVRPNRPDRRKLCLDCAVSRVTQNAYRRHLAATERRAIQARQAATTEA